MPQILLATCAELPEGGPEEVLPGLFAERGVTATWARWDDPDVDWGSAAIVAVRTTWDYTARLDEFLGWARQVESVTRLVNRADVLAWNTDKTYLTQLARWGVPTVPTQVAAGASDLAELLDPWSVAAVLKPAVAIGGQGLLVWRPGDEVPAVGVATVVQPLVATIHTCGEVSVFVMGGRATTQVVKHPVEGEVRVHEQYGGSAVVAPRDTNRGRLAERTVTLAAAHLAAPLPYARVDMLKIDGAWVVSELEVTEPGLYVEVDPSVALAYVDAMSAELARC